MFKNTVGNVATLAAGNVINIYGGLLVTVESVEKVPPHHRLVKMTCPTGRKISATWHEKDNVKII